MAIEVRRAFDRNVSLRSQTNPSKYDIIVSVSRDAGKNDVWRQDIFCIQGKLSPFLRMGRGGTFFSGGDLYESRSACFKRPNSLALGHL